MHGVANANVGTESDMAIRQDISQRSVVLQRDGLGDVLLFQDLCSNGRNRVDKSTKVGIDQVSSNRQAGRAR